ncbi:PiggyBac transposable element-derived protein [Trichinella pseudospiralis]
MSLLSLLPLEISGKKELKAEEEVDTEEVSRQRTSKNQFDQFLQATKYEASVRSIVLLSGYHSLPHVWSVQPDMGVPPVYNTMSGNPFVKLKNYIHFAVNQELTKALIRPWCYTSVAIMQKCLSGESLFALVIRSGCSTKMTATPTTLAYIKERINGLQWNPWEPGL